MTTADDAGRSGALVLFGATGDVAHKMIFPALYAMVRRGTLTVPVIGVAHSEWDVSSSTSAFATASPRVTAASTTRPPSRG